MERYKKQHVLVQRIISAYEDDSLDHKVVVANMLTEMQELGDPPQGVLTGL